MNKEQLLQELSNKINSGEISYDEMMNRFNLTAVKKEVPVNKLQKLSEGFSVTKMLYVLGAIIAVVGIVLFTYQIWEDIGSFGRISITFGLGLLITVIGSFLLKNKPKDNIGTVFCFMGGLLIPGGVLVTMSELIVNQNPQWPMALAFGVVFAFYLLLNFVSRNIILTFFTIANGTAFVYLTVAAISNGLFDDSTNLYAYLTLTIGATYIFLAHSFRGSWNSRLVAPLYFFGFAGIQVAAISQYFNSFGYYSNNSIWPAAVSFGLISAFYLFININMKNVALTLLTILNCTAFIYLFVFGLIGGSYYGNADIYAYLTMICGASYILLSYSFRNGWNSKLVEILNFLGAAGLLGAAFSRIFDSLPWQMFFFLLVMAGFTLSIYVKSRSILVMSTLFLIAYVSYITSEYFADSIGWPISLVILGFIFIALGYASITINKKYIKQ